MSKKQQPEPEEIVLAEGVVTIDPDVLEQVPVASEPAHWTESIWGVHAQWACAYCPFDTLDGEEAMAEHYRSQHAPPPPPAPAPVVLIADRYGNRV